MNIIDIFTILTYVVPRGMKYVIPDSSYSGYFNFVHIAWTILLTLRLMRILKLFRQWPESQALAYTLQQSIKEICLLLIFLVIGISLFSVAVYFAEKDSEYSGFDSIPASYWWALITMTTIGYGDISPVTGIGKAIGKKRNKFNMLRFI